jgi:hypothetical protein
VRLDGFPVAAIGPDLSLNNSPGCMIGAAGAA